MSFSSFTTESDLDIVTIYDGNSADGVLLESFSGTSGEDVVTSGNMMYITMISDGSVNMAGFEATVIFEGTTLLKPVIQIRLHYY